MNSFLPQMLRPLYHEQSSVRGVGPCKLCAFLVTHTSCLYTSHCACMSTSITFMHDWECFGLENRRIQAAAPRTFWAHASVIAHELTKDKALMGIWVLGCARCHEHHFSTSWWPFTAAAVDDEWPLLRQLLILPNVHASASAPGPRKFKLTLTYGTKRWGANVHAHDLEASPLKILILISLFHHVPVLAPVQAQQHIMR